MSIIRHTVITIITLICALTGTIQHVSAATRQAATPAELILRQHLDSLAKANTAAESLIMIYDVIDLIPRETMAPIAAMLYELARNDGGDSGALDVLRVLTPIYASDSMALGRMLKEAQKYPESDEREETILLINIYLVRLEAKHESSTQRREKLADMISPEGHVIGTDHYDRLLKLFIICLYIREETQGTLLAEHIGYLDHAMQNKPLTTFAIRKHYAQMKAEVFTGNSEPEAAIAADQELLKVLDEIEKAYEIHERKHMALHWTRYDAYCRLLRNALDVDSEDPIPYYRSVNALADSIPDVRAVYNETHYPDIYYLLEKKRYREVLPMMLTRIADEKDDDQRRFLLHRLMTMAKETGDKTLLLKSVKDYIPLLESYVSRKTDESTREMEIIYRLTKMRKQSVESEIESHRLSSRHYRRSMAFITGAIVLMITAIIVLLVLVFRFIKLSKALRRSNLKLLARRNELRHGSDELLGAIKMANKAEENKNAFIKYISSTISLPLSSIMEYSTLIVDGLDKSKRLFLERFTTVMQENSDQLRATAAKLQELGRTGDTQIQPSNQPENHDDIS